MNSRYTGTNQIMNILLVFVVIIFLIILISLLLFSRKLCFKHCCKCGQWFLSYLKGILIFNSVIRGLLESYLLLSISTFYQVTKVNFATTEDKIDFAVVILSIIYCIGFPVLAHKFLLKRHRENKLGNF